MTKKQIQEDVKDAMKAGDELKKGTLRMLLSSLVNKEKDVPANEAGERVLTEEQILQVIATEAKKRKEAADAFEKGGKQDMASNERQELEILQEYLPEQLSEQEIRKLVEGAISKTGASSSQDMGKVMAALMPGTKGKADGALVSKIVKESLTG